MELPKKLSVSRYYYTYYLEEFYAGQKHESNNKNSSMQGWLIHDSMPLSSASDTHRWHTMALHAQYTCDLRIILYKVTSITLSS